MKYFFNGYFDIGCIVYLCTILAPRPYHPRSMLASALHHLRIKSAPASPLYPALHAVKT